MKKLLQYLFLLLIPVLSANNSFSQTFEWEKIIGHHTNNRDRCNASAKLSASRYVFGGYNSPRVVNNRRMQVPWLVFVNPVNGDTLFTRSYSQFETGSIVALCANTDSTLMVVCESYDMNTSTRQNLMFKTDYQGNIIWQKYYINLYATSESKLIAVPDGYIYVSPIAFQLTKFDNHGNIIWQKVDLDSSGNADGLGFDITLLKDGSYLASGGKQDPNSSNPAGYFKTSPYLVQLRPNGDTIKTKVLGSIYDHDMINAVRQTSDGGLILAGRYTNNSNPTRMEGMVIKLDSAWNQEWWHTFYPKVGTYNDGSELYNVQETIDSSFIVSGYYRDDVPHPWGDAAGFVAKLSHTGSEIWTRQYQVNGIGEWFYDMVYNDDGSAVFSGNWAVVSSDINFYLVKLSNLGLPYKPDYCNTLPTADFTASLLADDTVQFSDLSTAGTQFGTISTWEWHLGDGTISTDSVPKHKYNQTLQQLHNTPVTLFVTNNSGCTDSITLYPFRTLSVSKQLPNVQVSLYPNPAIEQATITLSGYSQEVELQLLDVMSRKISVPVQQSLQGESQQMQLNTSSLPKGLYLYRLLDKGTLVATGKLVKD